MLVVLIVVIVCIISLHEKSGHLPDGWGTVIGVHYFNASFRWINGTLFGRIGTKSHTSEL